MRLRPPGLVFDCGGGGDPAPAGGSTFVLTHGHLDHALGLPFVLSYRGRHGGGATRVFCPAAIRADLERLVDAAAALERARYHIDLVGVEAGERIDLDEEWALDAFATRHVVPSLGYHVVRRVRRLAPTYRDRPGEELARLRRQGTTIEEVEERDWLTYCGDCSAGTLDDEPRTLASRRLVLECTFLGADARERAAAYGHVHFDDLVERRDRFANETLVLTHLSRKHRPEELRRAADERLGELAGRVRLLVS